MDINLTATAAGESKRSILKRRVGLAVGFVFLVLALLLGLYLIYVFSKRKGNVLCP